MFRLAVVGISEGELRDVGARLRGVVCHAFVCSMKPEALKSACDGVACVAPKASPDDDDGEEGEPGTDINRDSRFQAGTRLGTALFSGRPVLVDAGHVPNERKLDACLQFATDKGGWCVVRNVDRWLPSRQLIRQQLDAGKLGEPGLIRSHRWEPAVADGRGDPLHAEQLPVGLLRDLDVATWLAGAEPDVLFAAGSPESLQVHLGFPGGASALVGYGRVPEGDSYGTLSVIGSSGAAYADDHQNRQLLFRGGLAQGVASGEGVRSLATFLQSFADMLAAGTVKKAAVDAARDVDAWRRTLRLGRAVQRSLATKQAVAREEFP